MKQTKHNDDLRIRISGLSNGLHDYRFTVKPSFIGLEESFSHPVEVEASIDKTTRQILLRAKVSTSGHFQCDRCIENFEREIASSYSTFYVYDEIDGASRPPEEVTVLSTDTVHLDLREDIREIVELAVPLKLLCTEECKGLCPRCGSNWNMVSCSCKEEIRDSRWKGLEDLLTN